VEEMNCDHKTIVNHIHTMEKIPKFRAFVPHAENDHIKSQRATISAIFVAQYRSAHGHKQLFIYSIVTGR